MITTLYVVLMATLYIGHTWYLILLKRHARRRQVDWPMRYYDRASHGRDFIAQYTPLALLLLAAVEVGGAASALVHGLGLMLVAAALLHCRAFGFPAKASSGMVAMLMVTGVYAATGILALAQHAGLSSVPELPLASIWGRWR